MKIIKKFALTLLIFVLIASSSFLYFRYFSNRIPVFINSDEQNKTSEDELPTVFNVDEVSYVDDPDVGTVTGSGSKNKDASEFLGIFHVDGEKPEDITKIYNRFSINSVIGASVTGMLLGTDKSQSLQLGCLPEKTALFKSLNMEFVSAGFDIKKEIKVGDILFIKCETEMCEPVGTECIIVRFPSN